MRKKRVISQFKLKTIAYKILSIITAVLMLCGFNTSIVIAAENESYDYTYVKELNRGESRETAIFQLQDGNGGTYYAYCVDKETVITDGHNYSRVDVEYSDYYAEVDAKQIRAIVQNAYPFQTIDYMRETFEIPTLTEAQAIDAVQFAIWSYANSPQEDHIASSNENVKNLYNKLISLPAANPTTPIAQIDLLEPVTSFNGESYDVDFAYKVTGTNYDGSPVEVDYSFQEDLSQYGATVEVFNEDENQYKHIKVKNLPSATTINLKILVNQNVGSDVYFYSPEGGRKASQSLIGIHEGDTSVSSSISFTTKSVGEIVIKKVDANNNENLLKGAEFTIASIDNDYTVTVTTDDNGLATIKLPLGTYNIEETKAPDGYIKTDEIKTIEVSGDLIEPQVFVFENIEKTGSVILNKVDKENSTPLTGVEFELFTEASESLGKYTTGEDGKITVDGLKKGNYYFVETKALEGYVLNKEKIEFIIEFNQQSPLEITVENKKEEKPVTKPTTKPTIKPTTSTTKPTNTSTSTTKKPITALIPKTGDKSLAVIFTLLVLAIGGVVINNRKKIIN